MKSMVNMENYAVLPQKRILVGKKTIAVFEIDNGNIDPETVRSFGDEWLKFNEFSDKEIQKAGDQYFDIVHPDVYTGKYVLDVGCGTGRWSKYLSKKVRALEAIDPSQAVLSAASLLQNEENVRICQTSADNMPFPDNLFDLVFSIGVLHHIPDTKTVMRKCVEKVKPGGYFLVYLYYNFENRGVLFRQIFHGSNLVRGIVSSLPTFWKKVVCDLFAVILYLPLAALSKVLSALCSKRAVKHIPLSYYADTSMNIIRNDSLDRFGTPLEKRFSRDQIRQMMTDCGLHNIVFSEKEPYWHAIGRKINED